jgi:glucose-1-phosphate cytidylyltransferase
MARLSSLEHKEVSLNYVSMSVPRTMPKAVILAGGLGTRLSEETVVRPKPMVEIGGKPLLWHVMKIYAAHGVTDFVICCGFKGYIIKEYFANYFLHMSDVTFDMEKNTMEVHQRNAEPWRVTLVDTGEKTQTGGRLGRVKKHLKETFFLTYGDGVADVDITSLLDFHRKSGKKSTITAVQPPGRYGALEIKDGIVKSFREKPAGDGAFINGGFFVLEPSVLDLISGDDSIWERGPLEALAASNQLNVFTHRGFWQPVDTLREKNLLEEHWASGKAPWKIW